MKNQALFSSKDKSNKKKCRRFHFLFGALSVNSISECGRDDSSFKMDIGLCTEVGL